MDKQQIPLAHARYATNRLQRLAGHAPRVIDPAADAWRFDSLELANSLRELAYHFEGQARRACDDCPALTRSVAVHLLSWHMGRGRRGD